MLNKLTITVLGLLLAGLAVWQFQAQASGQEPTTAQVGKSIENNHLSTQTPAIQDALILEGWTTLRSLKEPVQLGDGMVVSGESLAQFLLESQIPVVWGHDGICGGGSCSKLYCGQDGSCSYEDGQPGIDPIYVNPNIRTQEVGKMQRLVGELAHEIYHRMRPFGTGTITQVEEYWAFYVGAQVSKVGFPKFDGIDPMNPDQLEHWFYVNGLPGYLRLPAYPGGAAQVAQAAKIGQAAGSE